MKSFFLFLSLALLCGLVACTNTEKSNLPAQPLEETDSCRLDPRHTYEIYIPERNSSAEKLPLVVIVDAHGGGKFALEKFKAGANLYASVLVASNLVKNGFENYMDALQTLVDDVRQKYPVSETIFMAGFSGGARMALGYSLEFPVNGLLMCGALAGADQINALQCPVFSISGTDDFNFVETAQFLFQDQTIPAHLKLELIHSSHTWPDSLILSDALGFLCLASRSNLEKAQVNTYCRHQQERMEKLIKQGDFLKAALIARNMSTTAPFSKEKIFASDYEKLKSGTGYNTQLKKLEKCLKFEMSVRQPYLEALTKKDSLWWKNEMAAINQKLSTEQDAFNMDMYRRIKAFWGIACYSLGNRAIAGKNTVELSNILSVYKMLEPENPDMLYFSAFPSFWKGNKEETLLMLRKARDAGFSDMDRIKRDFPESITSEL